MLLSEYWVLGINWGHLPARLRMRENAQDTRVLLDSSMSCVVPAWKVTELLNGVQDVVKPRQRAEAQLAQQLTGGAKPDVEERSDAARAEVPKADINDDR